MTDPYSVLEVSRDASDDEIKKKHIVTSAENIIRMPISIIRTRIRQRRNSKKSSRPISRS